MMSAATELEKLREELSKAKKGERAFLLEDLSEEAGGIDGIDINDVTIAFISACAENGLLKADGAVSIKAKITDFFAKGAKAHTPKTTNGKPRPGPAALETLAASSFALRGIRWLWPDRFALGKLGLIGGLPDKGKGLISCDLIACVTKNHPLPCNEGHTPQGNVIYFSAEDDIEDTIVPRLMAAGADLHRVHIATMMGDADGKKRTFSMVTDLEALRAKIDEIGDVALVIIDPMTSYLGIGKVNNSMTTDVRGFLKPLTDLAAEKVVSIIGIMHFNKKADVTNAMLRIADSLAYVAAARHVYVVVDDTEVDKRRLFVKAKNNLAPDKKALSYMTGLRKVGIDEETKKEIFAPYVLWGAEHVEITANEAMQAEAGGSRGRTERREAKEFLLDRLADGPVKKEDLEAEGEAQDISKATLRRAKKDLGIISKKGTGIDSKWTWELPNA
jgi:putative DNA primase/helicase